MPGVFGIKDVELYDNYTSNSARGIDFSLDYNQSFGDFRVMAKEKKITVVMSLHEIDLAQKISDKILCVRGDRIFCYGKPEEVFKEEVIRELYGLDRSSSL